MRSANILTVLLVGLLCTSIAHGAPAEAAGKKRLLVVSSYHKEYSWTQETNAGLCAAMLELGYFDNNKQIADYTRNDQVETSKAIIKKLWMDAKRKSSTHDKEIMSMSIYQTAREFNPDLIFLGDDDAAEYIGKLFLDTSTPVVFWGVNNTPLKYGLVESMERPGHNVTGIYQSGYYKEGIDLLKQIIPTAKSFAVLSDDTSSGRSHYKQIEYLSNQNVFPLGLVEIVSTSDFGTWKQKALDLQQKVDAFFIAQYSALKDKNGKYISPEEVAAWYAKNIKIPEAVVQRQFVQQGMLCAADDGGYNQGFEAVLIAHDILARGADPATYPPRAPRRGALVVNKKRAAFLGITLTKEMGIEEYID